MLYPLNKSMNTAFSLCGPLYNLGIYLLSVLPTRIDHLLLPYIHPSASIINEKIYTPDPHYRFSNYKDPAHNVQLTDPNLSIREINNHHRLTSRAHHFNLQASRQNFLDQRLQQDLPQSSPDLAI